MSTKKIKQLSYGNADFHSIRTEDCVYVDKTRFIELLEQENNSSQIFIRPRRFGKSLFLSTLQYYYDVNYADEFEQLFGDLYIGQHPTPRKNSYAVMEFDFSGLDTSSAENFRNSFSENVRQTVWEFLNSHKNIFPNAEQFIGQIPREKATLSILNIAFNLADEAKIKIVVLIDEYDHFANDLIVRKSEVGEDFYEKVIITSGVVRIFYEKLKSATDRGIIDRTFITGISPIILEDIIVSYNIATNYSFKLQYNEMLGFTHNDVNKLMDTLGIDKKQFGVDIENYYNGYQFNGKAVNKVYNPTMILYSFDQILTSNELPENLIDPNLSIDPKRLVQNEGNRNILIQIIKNGSIVSTILEKFSIDHLNNDSHFISLLFYMGLLTIKEPYLSELRLVIPNYSIQQVYWEQIRQLIEESSQLVQINTEHLMKAINVIALEGNIHDFIDYISQNVFRKLSDHDLQLFDEKYIKVLLLSYLLLNNIYLPISEYETDSGRSDIFLQRNPNFPQVNYEWVWELKYCKASAKKTEINQKRKEGLEQLNRYLNSSHLKDRPNLKSALLMFIGKDKYEIIEN
ncbi:MAG: ATP-binding protein [Planctomycetaceae bacterium]|jgi:hypothetical protein|nr:ATP-binding protein [Planctomycetaceae bacterium]